MFSNNLLVGSTLTTHTLKATRAQDTTIITNLNADLLDGRHADSLLYVNNATNTTLTRSGSGPYTLGLNLANANTGLGTNFLRAYQYPDGTPTSNLGSPSITEMALFETQFNNKPNFTTSTIFLSKLPLMVSTGQMPVPPMIKKKLVGGDANST